MVSYRFKKDSRARLYRPHMIGREWVLSFMTLAELDQWALVHRWGPTRRADMDRLLLSYAVHHSDRQLCFRGVQISLVNLQQVLREDTPRCQ